MLLQPIPPAKEQVWNRFQLPLYIDFSLIYLCSLSLSLSSGSSQFSLSPQEVVLVVVVISINLAKRCWCLLRQSPISPITNIANPFVFLPNLGFGWWFMMAIVLEVLWGPRLGQDCRRESSIFFDLAVLKMTMLVWQWRFWGMGRGSLVQVQQWWFAALVLDLWGCCGLWVVMIGLCGFMVVVDFL